MLLRRGIEISSAKHDYTRCINGLYFIENDIIRGDIGSLREVIGN